MAEMPLAEHNNMVKTIPSDRTDEPLRCRLRAMTANSAPPNGWRLLGVPIQPEDAGLLCVHFLLTSDHRSGHHE